MVVVTDKMEYTVDHDPIEFVGELCPVEKGILPDTVYADKQISAEDILFAVVEGDDIGEVIVLEILHIDVENIVIRTEDYVNISYLSDLTRRYRSQPLVIKRFVFEFERNVLAIISDHSFQLKKDAQIYNY